MPKLNQFKIKIQTGDFGTDEPVHFNVNGFKVPFENGTGGTNPGETFEASYEVNSHPHSLVLVGPDNGTWAIDKMTLDFDVEGSEPYSVTYGELKLDDLHNVNIWQDPPLPTFDV